MSVEIREMMAAMRKAEQDTQEVYQWLNGDRTTPLPPELKSRLVDMVADEFGDNAAAAAMDQVATQNMPEAMQ